MHCQAVKGCHIGGIGFATPFLGLFREEAASLIALMPARQGVINWPARGPNATALCDDDALPLADSSLDLVILMHSLELSDNADKALDESWRVLAPGGRLLAIVPNRRGLWARLDSTPFGHGRPFSRGQMLRLMREARFSPSRWSQALYFAPIPRRLALKSALFWEHAGGRLWPGFGGVLLVEATKQLYQGVPARERGLTRAMRPVLMPAPTA
jgi:SAM-dependent methyltransferase